MTVVYANILKMVYVYQQWLLRSHFSSCVRESFILQTIFTAYILLFLPTLFVLCGVMLSVCLFACSEVRTLGVWGELACHKRLFNPLPHFQGWAPGVLPVCVCVCVCVCVFGGLSILFCIWVEGLCAVVCRGVGGGGSGFFLFAINMFFS